MNILSVHHGHDASVTFLKNDSIVYNTQEERLTGIKHYANLPVKAIDLLWETLSISPRDIDVLVLSSIFPNEEINALFGLTGQGYTIYDVNGTKNKSRSIFLKSSHAILKTVKGINITDKFSFPIYRKTYPLSSKVRVVQVHHHIGHAASAYYTSGFDHCLVVTSDGAGDGLSTTAWLGENGKLEPIVTIGRHGSLGFFYNIITEALGWQISDGEGKVMGLAPYGSTKKTRHILDYLAPVYKDGRLVRGKNYGFPSFFRTEGLFHWHFPQADSVMPLIRKYGRENIAAEAQLVLEEQMLNFVVPLIKKYKIKQFAGAGGVFLNVKMNQRIWETGLLDKLYIYPDAGDGGIPVGAGLYAYHALSKKPYKPKAIRHMYWGPSYTEHEVKKVLDTRNLTYEYHKSDEKLIKQTATLLSKGKIVGWFQGKMESGPRALGNRSILMDPRKAENKDIINARVKYREAFRPFCPSMTAEGVRSYLKNPSMVDFMIVSCDVISQNAHDIPAVVHVDGTVRPQLVTRESNSKYHKLISEFGKLTGVPVVLNTSFNIRGQPVVCTPEDAVKCFYDTGLDFLIIGNYILAKK